MAKVVLCETMLKPVVVPFASESKGDGTIYEVVGRTVYNDPVCECPGFQFRGRCKHVAMLETARCTYHRVASEADLESDDLGRCSICQHPLVLFELDPELE